MCDQDQDQPYIAPGFDANLHDCSFCNDTGISQETASYCTACRMGKRIEQLDQFAEQLKGHGFTEAMRIVYRTTQRTEKAIAAADKALMVAQHAATQKIISDMILDWKTGVVSSNDVCVMLFKHFAATSPVSKEGE